MSRANLFWLNPIGFKNSSKRISLFIFFFLFLARGGWLPTDLRIDTGDLPGANFSRNPKISSSGNNVYVAWSDERNGGYIGQDIYFNYSTDGGATWQISDNRLDTGDTPGANFSINPRISCNGNNVYVVWGDSRNSGSWYKRDIYFNFSPDGGASWLASDIRIDTGDTAGSNHSALPQISNNDSNVYVVWHDWRNGEADIYFNYSTNFGATWQSSDIRLDTGDNLGVSESVMPEICCNGNYVYVVWHDYRDGGPEIYFNYSTDYGATWQSSDIRLDRGDDNGSYYPEISSSGNNVYVVWRDTRTYLEDIYFNCSKDGGASWQATDVRLDTGDIAGLNDSVYPRISSNGNNVCVVWWDTRNTLSEIYFNYSTNCGATWQTPDIRVNTGDAPGSNYSIYPECSISNNQVYVVYEDSRNGNLDIYFNKGCFFKYSLAIESSEGGTTRPKPGTHTYEAGTKAKIEAILDEGYKFSHWSGDALGKDNPIKITMDADKSIKANFIRQHTLTITSGPGGTTDPAPGTYTFDAGTEVAITAIPNNRYRFLGWSGDVSSAENPITITINSDISITANFIRQYTLTLTSGSGGTTQPSPGTYVYDEGTEVTISCIPRTHYRFSHWSGDASGTSDPLTITMDSDKTITANFIRVIYAPQNFTEQKVLNRSLFQVEYINFLTWQANSNNVSIVKYRIYQVEGNAQSLLVELNANTYVWHRRVARDKHYTYALVAVNNEGKEGNQAIISVQ